MTVTFSRNNCNVYQDNDFDVSGLKTDDVYEMQVHVVLANILIMSVPDTAHLWYCRMRHLNTDVLTKMSCTMVIAGLPLYHNEPDSVRTVLRGNNLESLSEA